jgi:hypothetical protein
MLKRIRDLDLDAIVETVARSTDVARGRACDALIQEDLDQSPRLEQRIASLRDYIGIAAMRSVAGPEELRIEQPLVEAFVRTHHHPAAPTELSSFTIPGKAPGGQRFAELANEHPELKWDKQIVKALLWRAIQANGDHEVDTAKPPWKMYWGPSNGAAYALVIFATYEALGSLEGTDPGADAARRQLEQQTIDLARQMRDAIDRYDDPDVTAQREAYEREKAERIGARLASFYVKTGQRDGNEPLDQAITKMLRYFAHRVDAEVPEVGTAPTIDQPLPTLDSGALVWLDLVSGSPARELVLRIKSPNGKTTKSRTILHGTKLKVITFLEAATTPNALIAAINEFATSGI